MLQHIWQKALTDSMKNKEKFFVGNENNDTVVSAFNALEVEKSLLTIKPQDFMKRAPCRRIVSLVHLPKKCQKKTRLHHKA